MNDTLGLPFNVRLSDTDREKLRELAAENDRTMQQEIRRAIRLYLEASETGTVYVHVNPVDNPRKG